MELIHEGLDVKMDLRVREKINTLISKNVQLISIMVFVGEELLLMKTQYYSTCRDFDLIF